MFQRIICILSYCPPYFDKNTSKISKFLAFTQALGHSTLNVVFLFLSTLITMVLLTVLLMLHAFTFFNIGNKYEDRIWKFLQYDHCHMVREPCRGGCVYVCLSVWECLPICAYGAVRIGIQLLVHLHFHHYLELLLVAMLLWKVANSG